MKGLDKAQKPALIISEMQNAMVSRAHEDRELARRVEQGGIVAQIARLAEDFRQAGAPVIHCTLVPSADYADFPVNCALWANLKRKRILYEGSSGAEIVEGLTPMPGDIVSQRRGGLSGFHATELERTLRALGVDTVVLTGVSTNLALTGLAIEAVNRLFQVVIPDDCVAGADEVGHTAQMGLHLPLLATIAKARDVSVAVAAAGWSA